MLMPERRAPPARVGFDHDAGGWPVRVPCGGATGSLGVMFRQGSHANHGQ
jgi:hypothetical protein